VHLPSGIGGTHASADPRWKTQPQPGLPTHALAIFYKSGAIAKAKIFTFSRAIRSASSFA